MISTWIHSWVTEGTNSQFLCRFLMSSSRVPVSLMHLGRISVYVWVFYYARPEAGNGTQGHSINTERQQARLINLLSIWCSIKRLWWNIWIFMYADTVTLNLVFPYHRPSMNLCKPFLISYEMQSVCVILEETWKTWSGVLGFWKLDTNTRDWDTLVLHFFFFFFFFTQRKRCWIFLHAVFLLF